jgi:predicted DCC family thiol-disulfide oxidoreductase YuxK
MELDSVILENAISSEAVPVRGWIFYDADCVLCVATMMRVRQLFASRGFQWVPLQTPGAAGRLGVSPTAFETRMHVLAPNGRVCHNADALAIVCRSVWWLWPLGGLLSLPGCRGMGRLAYNWLARNRYCLGGRCDIGGAP